jgi:hypothetical protein
MEASLRRADAPLNTEMLVLLDDIRHHPGGT